MHALIFAVFAVIAGIFTSKHWKNSDQERSIKMDGQHRRIAMILIVAVIIAALAWAGPMLMNAIIDAHAVG